MPHFQLISLADRTVSLEFNGSDPHAALNVATANKLVDAELWRNGKYVCTLRQASDAYGDYSMIVQKHGPPKFIKINTYSGLQFDARQATPEDDQLLAEFWRHVSRDNVAARSIGVGDPTDPDYAGLDLGSETDRTTLLAFGGDGEVLAIAILVPSPDRQEARAMVFTRDGTTFHGISWALLDQILLQAHEDGVSVVTSVFSVEDVRAIRLERKMGFVETEYPGNEHLRILRWAFEQAAAK